ncbi:MAG: prepilin peptidase [Cyanobacteria bacterium]|nr:prepilin peptidase [Cyanobacteriota bacterium]
MAVLVPPPLTPVPPAILIPVLVAGLGACIGSFVNVVAWRLPRQESLVLPGSHCPRCGTPLAWFENLPIIAWLALRGRCRHCHQPVSPRYPLVELLCAGLWVAVLLGHPDAMGANPASLPLLLAGWLLVSWLLPLVLIDLDSLWLPEPLCRYGLLLGLVVTALLGLPQGAAMGKALLLSHSLAAAAGLLGFEALSALAEKLMGRPALGLGDAKLAALMGAWLGPMGLLLAVALAVFAGALIGAVGRLSGRLQRHQPFAFGPFLAVGAASVWVLGERFWIAVAGFSAGA